jgi:hypothetical protein
MKKDFSLKSDNLHLNRRAAMPAFALRFNCKGSTPGVGNRATWLPKTPLRAGKRSAFALRFKCKKGRVLYDLNAKSVSKRLAIRFN